MIRLILLGTLSAAFFSSTFILNEFMSINGGHWLWSASLRYTFMILILLFIVFLQDGRENIIDLARLLYRYLLFWVIAGGIGFGLFYALICFNADYSPGWVIASTWQFTVVASLFILMLFGRRFPLRIWFFSTLIFIGVILVNISHINTFEFRPLLLGGLPVLLAAFCYPLGNQLIWEASAGKSKYIPHIESPLMDSVFNKVLLMSIGSLPLWILLICTIQPPPPSTSQIVSSLGVAVLSGIIATSLFLFARSLATTPSEIAGVDATQATEAVFAILGGVLFLHSAPPNLIAIIGICLIGLGLFLFIQSQKQDHGL